IWSTTSSCARESTTGRKALGYTLAPALASAKDRFQRIPDGEDAALHVVVAHDEGGVEHDGQDPAGLRAAHKHALFVHGVPDAEQDVVDVGNALDVELD